MPWENLTEDLADIFGEHGEDVDLITEKYVADMRARAYERQWGGPQREILLAAAARKHRERFKTDPEYRERRRQVGREIMRRRRASQEFRARELRQQALSRAKKAPPREPVRYACQAPGCTQTMPGTSLVEIRWCSKRCQAKGLRAIRGPLRPDSMTCPKCGQVFPMARTGRLPTACSACRPR